MNILMRGIWPWPNKMENGPHQNAGGKNNNNNNKNKTIKRVLAQLHALMNLVYFDTHFCYYL